MTLDLKDIRGKAMAAAARHQHSWTPLIDSSGTGAWISEVGNTDYDGQLPTEVIVHLCAANPTAVLALLDLVKELREAAVEHGLHPRECRAWLGTSNFTDAEHCSCGLSTAIEKARGA